MGKLGGESEGGVRVISMVGCDSECGSSQLFHHPSRVHLRLCLWERL